MGKVISLANQKGGSGKTTISSNLAVLWSNSGYKVAIIDADNQKSLSHWFESRKGYYGENDTGIELLKYNSSDFLEQIKEIKKKFDFIIIDSPPSITMDSVIIVRSSNHVFVPVQPTPVDIVATIPFLDLVKKERRESTVILNRVMPRARLTEAMTLRLRYAGAKIARSKITAKVILAETYSVGRGVVDIGINSPSSREIINLGNEILRKIY
ncbi:MAG: hypothetical protein CFH21_00683 [Alphaproteobacteria bacterium MarineAlpha5_Bin11]|nr:hypothetical protein [Pelagibacteraceae bacterium]PPR43764.1 MAG: hypothetical protein CFH21_00683 [Alphaproteobacteria bacterium MarineAlpha5_Bin11]PPR51335.1 MAG: hypothetical protein CFH20_00650 [Alphaproteobacteria bacterium MarineAlpha5_Bin10]|tara:strand:+ start:16065 stop:16700 length:636 start_codon:yes stop_codon:yes gene_type:complete